MGADRGKVAVTGSVNGLLEFISTLHTQPYYNDSTKPAVDELSMEVVKAVMNQGYYIPAMCCMTEFAERDAISKCNEMGVSVPKFIPLIPNETAMTTVGVHSATVENFLEFDWSGMAKRSCVQILSQLQKENHFIDNSTLSPLAVLRMNGTSKSDNYFEYAYNRAIASGAITENNDGTVTLPSAYCSAVADVIHGIRIAEAFDYENIFLDDDSEYSSIIAETLLSMDEKGLAHLDDNTQKEAWSLASLAVCHGNEGKGHELISLCETFYPKVEFNQLAVLETNTALFCYDENIQDFNIFHDTAQIMVQEYPDSRAVQELPPGSPEFQINCLSDRTGQMILEDNDTFLKALSDAKEVHQLSVDIDRYAEEYDPYHYKDVYNPGENSIKETHDCLMNENVQGFRDWLNTIISENDNSDFQDKAKDLLDRIDRVESDIFGESVVKKLLDMQNDLPDFDSDEPTPPEL